MSFLAEVLTAVEKSELEKVKNIPRLKNLASNYKFETLKYAQSVYVKFEALPKQNDVLLNKARNLEKDLSVLNTSIEKFLDKDLQEATDEVNKLKKELLEANHCIKLVITINEINSNLLHFETVFNKKSYEACMKLINATGQNIKSIPDDECLDAVIELNTLVDRAKAKLLNTLNYTFKDNINYDFTDKESTLKIKTINDDLREALSALYLDNPNIYLLNFMTSFLLLNVFTPLVMHTTSVEITEVNEFNVLKIEKTSDKPDTYKQIFKNIEKVVIFLKDNINFSISHELKVLGYIGAKLRDDLCELIITKCLNKTIPSTAEGLEKYKVVIEDTEKLHKMLVDCDIFSPETDSIINYANNIDVLFINKKCQDYYTQAEVIMKKDLHDMVEIGVPYDPNNPLDINVSDFLQCSISKSVIELKGLVTSIFEQALTSSDVCAGRLFCTIQKILTNYGKFVAEHHKKLLKTIPQQIALFDNNCKCLANEIPKWNTQYCLKLAPVLGLDNCTLKTECVELEKIANETFASFVEEQIKQINDIMKDAKLTGQSLTMLEPITEKCIRQCLRQQELLKTVWSKVLSYPTYNKTLGVIFNSLCDFIINATVKFEDIPSDVAEQLVDVIKIILNRGPKLFTDPNEISLYVTSWYKLNELNFVLSSSLVDINDRWADGKGPLALQFKPEELKQLVRSLFQNTDRRAAVLAKLV